METGFEEKSWIGQPAPDFTLPDLDGRPHALAQYRGRLTLINFWSAECPYAERVDRLLLPWLASLGGRAALLPLAANANEPPELLRTTAAQRGIPLVLRDESHRVTDAYGAVTTPHFLSWMGTASSATRAPTMTSPSASARPPASICKRR